jgi:hypothetical protein
MDRARRSRLLRKLPTRPGKGRSCPVAPTAIRGILPHPLTSPPLGGTKALRFGRMETSWSFTSLQDRMASAKRRSHAHFFLSGITGQLENVVDGVFLGAIYLACRRNLSVSIVAHGVADTLDVLLLFFGLYPTLR